MPMLLDDLAEETLASNRRIAEILNHEVQYLDESLHAETGRTEGRQRALDSARQATDYVLSQVAKVEGFWPLALAWLRTRPDPAHAEQLLRHLLSVFESGHQLVQTPRPMWKVAEQMGAIAERLDELDRAESRLAELAAQAESALQHRNSNWQPADPDRLAQGLQLAREGKTIKADEAREWFPRTKG